MKTSFTQNRARIGALAAAGTIAAALALTGCSASGIDTTADTGGDTAAASDSSALETKVAGFLKPLDAYDMPSEAVADGAALKGKTVYYVPITMQAPQFALTADVLADAADAVGAKLQVCNGDGTPSAIGQCIDGAVNDANTSTIILDGLYLGLATNGVKAAQDAGINVISGNQFIDDENFPESDTLGYVTAPGTQMFTEVASWVALDSKGTGNLLVLKNADGPGPVSFVEGGTPDFEADCPDCTMTTLDVSSANFSQVQSDLSSKLLQDPNINYVFPQFAQFLPVVLPALTDSEAKVGTGAATLGALQAVQGGKVAAASAQSAPFGAWAFIDTALRMENGEKPYAFELPTRLFTSDNVGDLDVTDAGEKSGAWFGPTTFADDFKELWGAV